MAHRIRTSDEVRESLNEKFESLFHDNRDGTFSPFVCICCDKILDRYTMRLIARDKLIKNKVQLTPGEYNRVNNETLENDYKFPSDKDGYHVSMKTMMLSPRAVYVKNTDKKKTGFTCCADCFEPLKKAKTPSFYSIINNNYKGKTPDCLNVLTMEELAFLSPLRAFGYCFTYTGGKQMNLKGTLSYYKVSTRGIVRGLAMASHLKAQVVILIHGKMTAEQRRLARSRSNLRIDKLVNAVEWLVQNNVKWNSESVQQWREYFENLTPVVHDESVAENGGDTTADANIEITERFSVYYPDGSMNTATGGYANTDEFKEMIKSAAERGYHIEMQCDLDKEFIRNETSNDTFVLANLLQFPYGRGGPNEERMDKDGEISKSKFVIEEYALHCSLQSLPQFHKPLFCLVLYNMVLKPLMLKSASMTVENGRKATEVLQGLDEKGLAGAIQGSRTNTFGGTNAARKYLRYIQAISGCLPHTNQAAGKAQGNMDCFFHNLGPPSIFVTHSYDDENSILMQIYSGIMIDDDQDVCSLSDEELQKRVKSRTELRLNFPGLAAILYEQVIDIIMEEVIGWNMKENCPSEKGGQYGDCFACTLTTEEQGRKSCHGHILAWIRQMREEYIKLKNTNEHVRRIGRMRLTKLYDESASTELFGTFTDDNIKKRSFLAAFDHKCEVDIKKRRLPELEDDQQLRNLRHKHGHTSKNGAFIYCPDCTNGGRWTNEEAIENYLMKCVQIEGLTSYPNRGTNRLHAMIVAHSNPMNDCVDLDSIVSHAAYNSHLSCHCNTCFKANKKKNSKDKRTRIRASDYECRGKFPCLPQARTSLVEETEERPQYMYDGTLKMLPFFTFKCKREKYDVFQNVCCKAITTSKISGNSNQKVLFPGPYMIYNTKYPFKKTQAEDNSEYNAVEKCNKRMLHEERKHEGDRAELMRMALRSAYAHNSDNIVSAPLAAYLTRKKSRFYFSHSFVWCSLQDMIDTIHGEEPSAKIRIMGHMKIVEKPCHNYLCRPKSLENLCWFEFLQQYEVRFIKQEGKKRNNADVVPFENTGHFVHPSFIHNRMRQGVTERDGDTPLIKITQKLFPDVGNFGGSIFSESTEQSDTTEMYSLLVMILFLPFRSINDMTENDTMTFTEKLRYAKCCNELKGQYESFLQNVQDCKYNYKRYEPEDELDKRTEIYQPSKKTLDDAKEEELQVEKDSAEDELLRNADIVMELIEEENTVDDSRNDKISELSNADICTARKGERKPKQIHISNPKAPINSDLQEDFIKVHDNTAELLNDNITADDSIPNVDDRVATKKGIWKLFVNKTTVRQRLPTKQTDVQLEVANGTAKSIIKWARQSGLDKRQTKTFTVLAATFVLTYYDDSDHDEDQLSRHAYLQFRKERKKLRKLSRLPMTISDEEEEQLIMFLHGPGGSGKSACIEILKVYAGQFCEMLGVPFTKNTIRITAMSGVAATVLGGDTAHSACALMRTPTSNDIDAFLETRMLILDEVSFASPSEIEKLDKKLRILKNVMGKKYGGLHIVFAGDFRQLAPVGKRTIYEQGCTEFTDWVNMYIELDGTHRFNQDKKWGEILTRMRNGEITTEDLLKINSECVVKPGVTLPDGLQYCSYSNRTRDIINTMTFEAYCENNIDTETNTVPDALIIFSDNLQRKTGNKVYEPIRRRRFFYENCGEDDIKVGQMKPRLDPALKIFPNAPMMLTHNKSVGTGEANGTCCTPKQVALKPGEEPFKVLIPEKGYYVKGVWASQVKSMTCSHQNPDIVPQEFELEPEDFLVDALWPLPSSLQAMGQRTRESIPMKMTQIPIVRNTGTTGHKLQGKTVESILVYDWNYKQNWAYVALSRSKTMKGVFMRSPLSLDLTKYKIDDDLIEMMKTFQKKEASYDDEDFYDDILEM